MTYDMRSLGISREDVVRSRPTEATRQAIEDTFALIADAGAHEGTRVRELLTGMDEEAAAACFREAEEHSLRLKVSFYDQFRSAVVRAPVHPHG
ncbi:hypothetical protein ACIQK5_26445 [Streptomyces virginiae]|uniref:hypothetical protein n=1 Tax=Streptomyces TaxID=1883 RepID=UPI00136C9B83|nr:hypothetical protein [Streptomyces sp. SID1046]MYV75920.1 hypothetical protein [Streptomyces sp. SID1046]